MTNRCGCGASTVLALDQRVHPKCAAIVVEVCMASYMPMSECPLAAKRLAVEAAERAGSSALLAALDEG